MAENKDEVSEEVTADVTETEEEGPTVSAEFSIEGIYNDKSNKHYTVYILIVLPYIKEAQNQHGLKHGDYQRYRYTCSNSDSVYN